MVSITASRAWNGLRMLPVLLLLPGMVCCTARARLCAGEPKVLLPGEFDIWDV